jgi:hypothetical protein
MNQRGNQTEEVSLIEVIKGLNNSAKFLMKRWIPILLVGIIGAIIGFTIAYFDEPIYTAELTLALDDASSTSNYSGIASQFGIEIGAGGGGVFSGENNLELMKSRTLIERSLLSPVVIQGNRQLLVNRYIDFFNLKQVWLKKDIAESDMTFTEGEARESFSLKKDSILYTIYKTIKKKNLIVDKLDKNSL